MCSMLEGIPKAAPYIDDCLIWSDSVEEHEELLSQVLQRLDAAGLKLNKDTCQFFQPSVEFLRHIWMAKGTSVLPSRLAAINNMCAPTSKELLHSFLGMARYIRQKSILHYSTIIKPLFFFFAFTFSLSSGGRRPGFYFSISCSPGRPLPSNQAPPVSSTNHHSPPWLTSFAPLPFHWHLSSLSHHLVFTLSQHVSIPPQLVNLYHQHHTRCHFCSSPHILIPHSVLQSHTQHPPQHLHLHCLQEIWIDLYFSPLLTTTANILSPSRFVRPTPTTLCACSHWLFSTLGLLEEIVSDNGTIFCSKDFEVFLKSNGIRHIWSSVYYPQSNSLIEWFHSTLKKPYY